METSSVKVTNERAERERDFHDEWAQSINVDELLVYESFESPTAVENRYAVGQMGALQGKKILDLGCGAGETSVYFALKGAYVTGCDISNGLLKIARKLADKFKVPLALVQCEASRLPCQNQSFDFVFGNGVLHHVALLPAAEEIKRVLKPGGAAIIVEPLPYNPVINVYRYLARKVRTEDEKPLSFQQMNQLKKVFSSLRHEEFWLFSLFIFLHFFFVRKWHPSKVRYWKKVIEEGEAYKKLFSRLQSIDRQLMRWCPILKPLCWNTVLTVTK
jgi:SAM-dependent methyltransferase